MRLIRISVRNKSSLDRLTGLLKNMRVHRKEADLDSITSTEDKKPGFKDSKLFNQPALSNQLSNNPFDELIKLTEDGKLWKYPIDNEAGLEAEKQVPFEDHVFLDHLLEDFPKNDYIQSYMKLVISGLARNHWMTVERKHDIVKFHKDYFEEKQEYYNT